MATPFINAATVSHDSSENESHMGANSEHIKHVLHAVNMPLVAQPGTFQATYDGTNDRSAVMSSQNATNSHLGQANPIAPSYPSASGPRRGSFPDILPDGHTPPPAINESVLNLRNGVLEKPRIAVHSPDDARTDSDPEFRFSTPASRMTRPPRSTDSTDLADASTIVVFTQTDIAGASGVTSAPAVVKNTGSRRNKNYTLPDGSVVSGKGLGRGRPGIKRGPRKSQPGDQPLPQVAQANALPVMHQDVGPVSKKRKSNDSDASNPGDLTLDSAASDSRESSEEYNPTGSTRFGRQTQKPTVLATTTAASASPLGKLSRNNSVVKVVSTSNSPATIKTHPKIKRRVYRGREQFALCEHCLRGYGPPGNVIVFCDACNKCWHQRCHEPQISKQTVADSKAEWYCADCDRILHGKKKDKKGSGKAADIPVLTAPPDVQQPPPPVYAGPLVGGRFIKPDQKVAYLKTLSKDDLVSRLLHAADLAPDLPIFQTLVPPPPPPTAMPQPQFTSTYVTPVSKMPSFGNKDNGEDDDVVDEGYDGYFDEHAALYPKSGQGLQLPPEREDLHMLLEGKASTTFSHWVRQ